LSNHHINAEQRPGILVGAIGVVSSLIGGTVLGGVLRRAWVDWTSASPGIPNELPENLVAIHVAQLSYHGSFDVFLPLEPTPRPVTALDDEPQDWSPRSGFAKLGWQPTQRVRGTYWVEVDPDGADFVAHGMVDADADGVPAHGTVSRNGQVTMRTPPEIH